MDELEKAAKKQQIGKQARHLFLCCDQTAPKCCTKECGLLSWEYLKRRIAEIQPEQEIILRRTKASCLRICVQGPIAVVYPDGVWYHSCTPEALEKILQQHLIGGSVVEEFLIPKMDHCSSDSATLS